MILTRRRVAPFPLAAGLGTVRQAAMLTRRDRLVMFLCNATPLKLFILIVFSLLQLPICSDFLRFIDELELLAITGKRGCSFFVFPFFLLFPSLLLLPLLFLSVLLGLLNLPLELYSTRITFSNRG